MDNWIDEDIWRCRNCSHWSSSFPATAANSQIDALDEKQRRAALHGIRQSNAVTILKEITSHLKIENPMLCDVGTAYGWFLSLAQKAGFESIGIEPDRNVAEMAIQQGLPVRIGEFPQCLSNSEQFDVLTFNDVFEHLPEPSKILDACRFHMRPGGLLVIDLPSSQGGLFWIARQLRRIGMRGTWDRLWQRSFPCPHCHYYSPSGLKVLLQKAGFQVESTRELPSFHYRGLWNRVRMQSDVGNMRAILLYFALLSVSPVLRLLRSDIILQVYRVGPQPVAGR